MYPVQIVLDEGNLAIQLREVQEWFHRVRGWSPAHS